MSRAKPLPPDERRASLIAVTRRLILDAGPEVTTRQVAEAAGVAEGTLFRVFATRRDLIVATILDELSADRLAARLNAIAPSHTLDATTELCVATIMDYLTNVSRLIPWRSNQDADAQAQVMEQWDARIEDLVAWMRGRLLPFADDLQVPLLEFGHVVFTLAMGAARTHCPAIQATPASLAHIALDGARRKDNP